MLPRIKQNLYDYINKYKSKEFTVYASKEGEL